MGKISRLSIGKTELEIQKNISLLNYNTFGVDVKADHFSVFNNENELTELLDFNHGIKKSLLMLGSGSNILFTKNFKGLVLINNIFGKEIIYENESYVLLKCSAGENWDDIVKYAVENNFWGIENLSLIPGKIGAAPIQNIGAYGVELKDVLYSVDAIEIASGKKRTILNEECQFGYRTSIFKRQIQNKYVIVSVTLKLSKIPKIHFEYFESNYIEPEKNNFSLIDMRRKIISLRRAKLPDTKIFGNAGSFFKNPVVAKTFAETLLNKFPKMPIFTIDKDKIKLSAGWLIEKCKYKGFRRNQVGTYKNHALIIINYGKAKGSDILDFSKEIQSTVYDKFGINLIPEVIIH